MRDVNPQLGSAAESPPGIVCAIASVQRSGDRPLLFAGTCLGVYQSVDLGKTWYSPAGDGMASYALTLAPSPFFAVDQTIFAGSDDGVWRSSDGGRSWNHVLGGSDVQAVVLAVIDQSRYTVLVGSELDGVLRSDDAGTNWSSGNPGLLDFTVLSLAVSPSFQQDQTAFAGTPSGLYRSTNAGRSWRAVELPINTTAVQCLAVLPSHAPDHVILAGTEADGMLRSGDGGRRWKEVQDLESLGVTAIACAPGVGDRYDVACATGAGLAHSADEGATWRIGRDLREPVLALTIVGNDEEKVYVAGLMTHGLIRSEDEGVTWDGNGSMPNDGAARND